MSAKCCDFFFEHSKASLRNSPLQLDNLEKRCKLPSGVRDGAPVENAFSVHFDVHKRSNFGSNCRAIQIGLTTLGQNAKTSSYAVKICPVCKL